MSLEQVVGIIAAVSAIVVPVVLFLIGSRGRHRGQMKKELALESRATTERQRRELAAVEGLVRACESRRVLWNDLTWEQPSLCYDSVQGLRREILGARQSLPSHSRAVQPLDAMKRAAERFCSQMERQGHSRTPGFSNDRRVHGLVTNFRNEFLPPLSELQKAYEISAGDRASHGPLGKEYGTVFFFAGPNEANGSTPPTGSD